ncbi:response regulator transcription factor [Dyadobacter sp. 22481]|uniref:response regulator transcription factor n=1 Tax=Dyadobacter sp. 22481 TaxID=3453926 RepID=UPI003F8644EB
MKKILIVEDHFMVRISLKIMLNEVYGQAVPFEAENFDEVLQLIASHQFELILLDIDIPGGKGTAMIAQIRQQQPEVVILVCSAADEEKYALDYIAQGANGYLSKSAPKNEAMAAIATVMKRNKYVSQIVQQQLLDGVSNGRKTNSRTLLLRQLSSREDEIMKLMLEGKWIKEIAATLDLRANTVSTYKARIFEKMGVTNVFELFKKVNAAEKP